MSTDAVTVAPTQTHPFQAEVAELLRLMVERGPLVDGVSGKKQVAVDGLPFETYGEILRKIGEIDIS